MRRKLRVFLRQLFLVIELLLPLVIMSCHQHSESKTGESIQKKTLVRFMDSIQKNYYKIPVQRLNVINQAVFLSKTIHDTNTLAKAFYYKASCFIDLEVSDSVPYYCNKATILAIQQNNKILIARIKNVMANYYLDKDDYYNAMVSLKGALIIFEELGRDHDIGIIYNGLGLVNFNLKDYDKAIEYYLKAIKIFNLDDSKREKAVIYQNMAGCYVEKNNFQKADQFYREALKTFQEINDSMQIVGTFINMSNANRKNRNNRQAELYLEKAGILSHLMNNQRLTATILYNRGTLFFDAGNLDNAEKYVTEGLAIFKKIIHKEGIVSALGSMSEICRQKGEYEKALDYYKEYVNSGNDILNGNTLKQIADLQWKYDVKKKDLENKILENKYLVKKKQNFLLVVSFGILIFCAVLIGLLIHLTYKNLRKSISFKEMENNHLNEKIKTDQQINHLEHMRLTAEIEAKNKELTTTSLQLISKNEILTNISELIEQSHHTQTLGQEPYILLKQLLKENLNQDKQWAVFKQLFEKVHQNFFKNIKSLYPTLTENEIRVCAYLKINLRNKEIAKILNVLPESIKTTRYHIRKKLNLDKDIKLEDFIRSL